MTAEPSPADGSGSAPVPVTETAPPAAVTTMTSATSSSEAGPPVQAAELTAAAAAEPSTPAAAEAVAPAVFESVEAGPSAASTPEETPPATEAVAPIGGVARATALTEDLIERGAPWSPRSSWTVVAVEGVVAIVLGLVFLFEPLGGQSVTLQLMGLILLVAALITAFQLWQHKVRPDLDTLVAFRTGSGLTVGLVVIAATLFAASAGPVAAAMAVVVGIGYLVFGLTGVVASLVRRRADAELPVVTLAINGVLAAAGLVLLVAGAAGTGTVGTVFKLLGVVLIVTGLALTGYAYLMRQQVVNGVRG